VLSGERYIKTRIKCNPPIRHSGAHHLRERIEGLPNRGRAVAVRRLLSDPSADVRVSDSVECIVPELRHDMCLDYAAKPNQSRGSQIHLALDPGFRPLCDGDLAPIRIRPHPLGHFGFNTRGEPFGVDLAPKGSAAHPTCWVTIANPPLCTPGNPFDVRHQEALSSSHASTSRMLQRRRVPASATTCDRFVASRSPIPKPSGRTAASRRATSRRDPPPGRASERSPSMVLDVIDRA
jgi:hypothetical protein